MSPTKIKEGVYWVGEIDWNLRNFHGYLTQRGSTYNAFLIQEKDKTVLIDTVKPQFYEGMLRKISQIIDPASIDYIVVNHVEMDHSGGLPQLMKRAKGAEVLVSSNGKKGLEAHYNTEGWNMRMVKSGDTLSLGAKKLSFYLTPMVHWPDNMVTFLEDDNILFSNDAFGQHLATSERFEDQCPLDIVLEEAKKYYANIVLPYSNQVNKAMDAISSLSVNMIAPSHGLIWRSRTDLILESYKKWAANQTDEKALIIYDTMWGSTEKLAYTICESFRKKGITAKMVNLRKNHISDIMTDVLSSRYICIGSPTLNSNIMPTVSEFMTYFKGLAPQKRIGLAFGSYGWKGNGVETVEQILQDCGFQLLHKIKVQYVPKENVLQEISSRLEEEIEAL